MRIKKQINEHFNSISLPSADKVLPKEALVEKQNQKSTHLTLKLVITVLCIGAIITSVVLVLNKSLEPNHVKNTYGMSSHGGNIISSSNAANENNFESSVDEHSDYNAGNPDFFCGISADEATEYPEPDNQEPVPNVLTVYTNSITGEFAGDMYRPEGYDEKIGSALALMMWLNEDEEIKFNVLVHTYDTIDLKSFLLQIDDSLEVITVEIEGRFAGQAYYICLTDAQIKELTQSGLNCYYIGSGLGDIRDMNWETEEGIRAYCEIWGDMYTFNNRDISCNPDIHIED